jgi:pimeloyl-ACP methyl ester carboxylesterase
MLPAPVVGHSLGGAVALSLAVRRPESVIGVVLAGAATIGMRRPLARALITVIGLLRPARAVSLLRGLVARTPWLRRPVFGGWGASDPPAMPPAAVEAFLAPHCLHTDTRSAGRALLHGEPPDLGRVGCPCLVLWGARDRITTLETGFEYARRLGAPLRAIADCGHLLIGERPDACLDAIEDFLDRVG